MCCDRCGGLLVRCGAARDYPVAYSPRMYLGIALGVVIEQLFNRFLLLHFVRMSHFEIIIVRNLINVDAEVEVIII